MMAWRWNFQALFVLLFSLASASGVAQGGRLVLNVKDYGAVADGKTENSQAFLEAWKTACEREGQTVITVPKGGKFYVRQVSFRGPCKGYITFQIQGDLYAPTDRASHTLTHWIKFGYVSYLVITGGGNLYGGGSSAWPYKGCGQGQACMNVVPHSLRLEFVSNVWVNHIKSIDSKDKHISIYGCNDTVLSKIRTTAPYDSPNTDGVHIALSRGIQILDAKFNTGDDCIAIFSGSTDVNISRSVCGPGHGISLGSMGRYPDEEPITNIRISNSKFTHSDNGFRIKTWAVSSYPVSASKITVEDVHMDDVLNPIIIDQYYCPSGGCNQGAQSNVRIKDIKISRIWGISRTKTAVSLHCSSQNPCQNVQLQDIALVYRNPEGKIEDAVSSCSNVRGSAHGLQLPKACIWLGQPRPCQNGGSLG